HHEQYDAYQRQFKDHCVALIHSFQSYQNPFCELGTDLITLDTRESVSPDIVKVLFAIEKTGRDKYMDFVEKRIKSQTTSFYSPIPKSSIRICVAKKKPLHPDRLQIKMAQLKEDNLLYWRLYVASISRKFDLETFFEFENQNLPPSLCALGVMRSGSKAELVKILETYAPSTHNPSVCQGLIIDGAHIVYNVPPRHGSIPKDWGDYLKNSENKMELFKYLSTRFVRDMECFKIATNVGHTFETREISITCLQNKHCLAMEEADPRIITHLLDMTKNGARSVTIRSTDTDVVILAASAYHRLSALGLQELWVHFGTGPHARYLAIHNICTKLGVDKCEALPGFHAFTGCDTTSYFSGALKPKCWKVWDDHPEITNAFKKLGSSLPEVDDETFAALERFTVLIYDATSTVKSVTLARKDLVVSRNRSIYTIPPTQGCLRALYQAGHLWGRALEENPEPPLPPTHFGRRLVDNKLVPVWTTLPLMWDKCREVVVMCGCKKGCETQNCSCQAANLPCCAGCKSRATAAAGYPGGQR
ncbi:hypothetical protein FOCC_FOCC016261, partial [Frankliniella occidentalis]